jgi:hypothetical protein
VQSIDYYSTHANGRMSHRVRVVPAIILAVIVLAALVTVASASTQPTRADRETTPIPVEPPAGGEYHFANTRTDGTPIGWDPCKPIPYWIGSRNLPGGGTNLVTLVLAEITAISGQRFDFQGYTDTVPNDDDYNPVDGAWIGWTTETSTQAWVGHELEGDDPAVGLATYPNESGMQGWAMLRYSYNRRADARAGAVLRHELGHLLGLAHTHSTDEAMSPGGGGQRWGPGDRRGLWLLGPSRGCN